MRDDEKRRNVDRIAHPRDRLIIVRYLTRTRQSKQLGLVQRKRSLRL